MKTGLYNWTRKDKWLYVVSMIPFLLVFFGTLYILWAYSPILPVLLFSFYLLTNVFQAGCCVGCPYRGKYCPALCGVYLGNLLSIVLYRNRKFDQDFFNHNAQAGEIMLLLTLLFPIYWVYKTNWILVPVYLLLLAAHFLIFMPTQCEKCGYNTTCPGGQAWRSCRKLFQGFRLRKN